MRLDDRRLSDRRLLDLIRRHGPLTVAEMAGRIWA